MHIVSLCEISLLVCLLTQFSSRIPGSFGRITLWEMSRYDGCLLAGIGVQITKEITTSDFESSSLKIY